MVAVQRIANAQDQIDRLKKRVHQQRARLNKQERALDYLATLCYDNLNLTETSDPNKQLMPYAAVLEQCRVWRNALLRESSAAGQIRKRRIDQTLLSIAYISNLAIAAYGDSLRMRLLLAKENR